MNKKMLMGVVASSLAVLCSAPSWAGWSVHYMKPEGSDASQLLGLSGSSLVGRVATPEFMHHAAIWSDENSQWTDLNPSGHCFSSINAASGNQQVGEARDNSDDRHPLHHAVMWTGTVESMVDLHPDPLMSFSCATAVFGGRQAGCVGGLAFGNRTHAGIWSGTAESWTDLNPSGFMESEANGIYEDSVVGWAAGQLSTGDGERHAFLWDANTGSWTNLGPEGYSQSIAYGVWGDTQVGMAGPKAGMGGGYMPHAGLWKGTADSWVDLNPEGWDTSSASAVCAGKQVGSVGGSSHAAIWSGTADSFFDLHSLLSNDLYQSEAAAVQVIGDDVWVAGWANGSSSTEAILWHYTPDAVPEPSSILAMLCGIGGLGGFFGRRRK